MRVCYDEENGQRQFHSLTIIRMISDDHHGNNVKCRINLGELDNAQY